MTNRRIAGQLVDKRKSERHRSTLVGILLLTVAAIALPWPAGAETRVALVIGNSAYPSGPLSSPKNDAEAVAKKLTGLGFEVTKLTDVGRDALLTAIRDFGQRPGSVGLFYYSGHGMQVNNRNYMIPIDAEISDEADVEQYGVPIENMLTRMELGKTNLNIVILDACRNNPFQKRFKSAQSGLAPIDRRAGTLIAFAAAPGSVAEAGLRGELSLYTQVLLEHIDQPYQNFQSMFEAVQNAVYQRSGRKQSPRLEIPPDLPDFSFTLGVTAIPAPPSYQGKLPRKPPETSFEYFDDFSSYTPGSPPSGWLLRGVDDVTVTVKEVGGTGPSYRLVEFQEVPWQYWDRTLLKDRLIPHAPYIVTVKLNFQNNVADGAGLTIAWNDTNSNHIDIQPNVYWDEIVVRSTYKGPIQSNVMINNAGRGSVPISPFMDYWLRVGVEDDRPGQGQLSVLWSTDGTNFRQVMSATGLQDLRGLVGVSTAGPHLPHVYFDDFSVSAPTSTTTESRQ